MQFIIFVNQHSVVLYVDKKIGQLRADNPPGSKFGVIVPGPGYCKQQSRFTTIASLTVSTQAT